MEPPAVLAEPRRYHYTRACMLSTHTKCLGSYESPTSGQVACDCSCHQMQPTLWSWSEPEQDEQ
jgi:hypothetical protein